MSDFRPLTFALHGIQVAPHAQEPIDMVTATQSAAARIQEALHDAGGMLTALQLSALLDDVPKGTRVLALTSLRDQGLVEARGDRKATVYELVRPGERAQDVVAPAADEANPPTGQVQPTAAAVVSAKEMVRIAMPTTAQPNALDLRKRLDAIADDIHDALQDGVTAELPHALLTHLVNAAGAIRGACKSYPA